MIDKAEAQTNRMQNERDTRGILLFLPKRTLKPGEVTCLSGKTVWVGGWQNWCGITIGWGGHWGLGCCQRPGKQTEIIPLDQSKASNTGCSPKGVDRAEGAREGGVTQRSGSCWTETRGPSFAVELLETLPPLLIGAQTTRCPCWGQLQKQREKISTCFLIFLKYFLLLT